MMAPTMTATAALGADAGSGGQVNARVADMLRQAAALLAAQQANPFRVMAYREAARRIAELPVSVRGVFDRGGRAGLDALPAIGPGIAGAIAEILLTGRWSQLERLRGQGEPWHVFQTVPGLGAELSRRIHDELQIDTLEGLEAAAFDGRLARVRGVGPRRASTIQAVLAQLLDRGRTSRREPAPAMAGAEPPVEMLLAVDRDYRAKAQAGTLPKIAPRRFNPTHEAWLPVWHTQQGPWHFTALYSNTARAHELERERDWVVLYFHDDNMVERQHTIVTETRGSLAGRRVVRGRERECRAWYEAASTASLPAGARHV